MTLRFELNWSFALRLLRKCALSPRELLALSQLDRRLWAWTNIATPG